MVRQAEDILEQDPPLIPVAYEQIYDAWYNKVRGQNPSTYFGIYDVVRWDQVWMAELGGGPDGTEPPGRARAVTRTRARAGAGTRNRPWGRCRRGPVEARLR